MRIAPSVCSLLPGDSKAPCIAISVVTFSGLIMCSSTDDGVIISSVSRASSLLTGCEINGDDPLF